MHRVPSVSGEQATALRNAAEILCALSPLPPLDTAKPPAKGHTYSARQPSTVIGIPVKQYEFEQAMLRQRKATKVSPGSSPTAPHMLDQVMTERKGAKALSPTAMGAIPPCNHCGEMESPQWRKGPSDKPHLCNACGTRYLRKGSLNHSANRRNSLHHKVQHKAVAHAAALAA